MSPEAQKSLLGQLMSVYVYSPGAIVVSQTMQLGRDVL